MTATSADAGPLRGIRVVDLTVNVLGPTATQILGDMGADVIKVETPEGDPNRSNGPCRNPGMAAMFLSFNRNKRSLALDLKRPEAREALMKVIEGADVFVHSLRASSVARLGFSYEDVSARNPRIIYANGPGYMRGGGRDDEPMYDDVIQGATGIADLMGQAFGEPQYFPTVLVDKFCGYVLSSAIAMALFERERSGEGQQVQVPMYETMVQFNLLEHLWGANFVPTAEEGLRYSRLMTRHRRPYRTKDGHVCVMAANDSQWVRLLTVIGRGELLEDERFCSHAARSRNIDALYGVLSESMATRTSAQWLQALGEADLPCGPVRRFEDLLEDPYLRDNGIVQEVEHPSEGPLRMVANPMQLSAGGASYRRHAPRLGEHNAEILGELGMSEAQIDALLG
jgi:crotonobetainyl-CoA:carnitine CoA-transferase CaiB-like acyl-CoA transferase